MKKIFSAILFSLPTFLFSSFATAQPSAIESRIDSLFKEWDSTHKPGASVAVVQNGKVVFKKGYGMANLEYGIPNSTSTIFHIASVSKQFTAFSILLLAEEGKLSVDDDVRKYIPEVPDFGKIITLRHLVTHTSGMRDQWNLLAMAGWRLDDVITKDHVMTLVSQQKELNFNPGDEYFYCNTGFTLLAEVVSRVSGKSFAEFTQERIFGPLQMVNTLFYDDHEKIVNNRAYSYHLSKDTYKKSVLSYANVGATSLFTTVEDLSLWAINFKTQKIGNARIIEQLNTLAILNNGKTFGGAMGQFVNTYKGLNQISHGGADAGYRTYLGRFPDQDFSVIVFSNYSSFNTGGMAMKIVDIYLADKLEKPTTKTTPAVKYSKLTRTELEAFTGTYWNNHEQYSRKIYLKNDTLRYSRGGENENPIMPVSKNVFKMLGVDVDLEVKFEKSSNAKSMTVTIDDADPSLFESYTPTQYSAKELLPFTGTYYSEELGAAYTINLENDKLVGRHMRTGNFTLEQSKGDIFNTNKWYMGNIEFVRDENSKITGFKATNGRVRNLWFEKR